MRQEGAPTTNDAAVLTAALEALARGDVAAADARLTKHWPEWRRMPAEALHALSRVRIAQKRLPDAASILVQAIKAKPHEAKFYQALGDVYVRAGEWSNAVELLAEALKLNPVQPGALRAYARALINAGRCAEGESQVRLLLQSEPDSDAWDILSCALRGQERIAEAVEAGDQAVKLDGKSASARHNRALAIARAGDVETALREFESLTARGVRASALAGNHAKALLELGRSAEAERVLAAGVRDFPSDPSLHISLAQTRWLMGQGDSFTAAFEAAIENQPDNSALRAGCVDLLRRAGQAQKAEVLLRAGLMRRPGDMILSDALGVLLDESDRTAEAAPLLQKAFERAPQREEGRSLYVRALLRLGESESALALIEPMRKAVPFGQLWICLESMALRQLGSERYHWLCDYDLMVSAYDLPVPSGYASIADFNADFSASLLRLHAATDHPLDQTLRSGTQSSRNLLFVDDPVIRAYFKALREPIAAYIATMRDPDHPWSGRRSSDFAFAGAWSVRLKPGGYHVNHIHPAGWISSAYYVSLPAQMNAGGDQQGWIKFGEPPLPTPGCGVEKVVQPKAGRLVLFPSYMWHGTIPFSEGERITAPFDVVPA